MIQIPCDHMNTRQCVKVCQGFLGFASGEMQGIRPVSTQETPAPCLHLARAAECWHGVGGNSGSLDNCQCSQVAAVGGGIVSRSPESFAIKSLLKHRFYKLVTNCMHSAHDEQILVRQPSHVMKSVLNTRHWSRFIPA